MGELAHFELSAFRRNGLVKKDDFDLTILREGQFSVTVDRLPLVEYFVFFDHPVKAEQIKVKVYKTKEGKWYDRWYSEEAELNSPEFGAPAINNEIKKAIDKYESIHEAVNGIVK
jgi:hypothetical protein